MKTHALTLVVAALLLGSTAKANDFTDRLKRSLNKAADKVGEAAQKVGDKSRSWYSQAKENLRLTPEDYIRRADKQMATMNAQIVALTSVTTANAREYFKTRLLALEQHFAFADNEFTTLQLSSTEEEFRARQKGFEYTVHALEDAIFQAQDEAGL